VLNRLDGKPIVEVVLVVSQYNIHQVTKRKRAEVCVGTALLTGRHVPADRFPGLPHVGQLVSGLRRKLDDPAP
jgi:hypothetical protein